MWKLSEKPFVAAGKIPSLCNEVEFFPESSSLFDLTAVIVAHFVCLCFWLFHCPAEKSGHRPLFEFPFPTSNTQLCRIWNSGRKKNIFVRSSKQSCLYKKSGLWGYLKRAWGKDDLGCKTELVFFMCDPQIILPCVQYGGTTVVGLAVMELSENIRD